MPKETPYSDSTDKPYRVFSVIIGVAAAIVIAAIAYLALTPNPARASDIAGITQGTYLLHMNGAAGCSAQAVKVGDRTLILTANHCVEDKKAVYSINRITFDDTTFDKRVSEIVFYVDVLKRDIDGEVAVLRTVNPDVDLETVDLATIEEAKAALLKGAVVLTAGFPGTQNSPIGDLVFTDGMFTGLARSFVPTAKQPMYRTTAPIYYGNSGGGLYIEVGGSWKLVGITSQTDPELRWANSLFATRDVIEKNIRLTPKPATDK